MARVDLSDKDDKALVHEVLAAERRLVEARFQHSLNKLEDTSTLGKLRKQIARLKTELRSREIRQGLGKNALMRAHRGSYQAVSAPADADKEAGGFLSGVVDKLTGKE